MRSWFPEQSRSATLIGALLIVCVWGAIGVIRNVFARNPIPFVAKAVVLQPLEPNAATASGQTGAEPLSVTLDQAAGLSFDASAIFVDARAPEEYAAGHIDGAVNLPSYHFDDVFPKVAEKLKGKTIVTYCDGGECEASILVARRLLQSGYPNVLVFMGGWPQWQGAGYPSATGSGEYQ